MNTINITVIDKRVHDCLKYPAPAPYHFVVDGKILMKHLFEQIKTNVGRNKITMLTIVAHGYAERGKDGKVYDGFGMVFCKEDLIMETAYNFAMFDGFFASKELGITLLGCGVAAQQRFRAENGETMIGFGESLCKAIAQAASTGVKASTSRQVMDIDKDQVRRNNRGLPEVFKGCAQTLK